MRLYMPFLYKSIAYSWSSLTGEALNGETFKVLTQYVHLCLNLKSLQYIYLFIYLFATVTYVQRVLNSLATVIN